jgi:hypothetical protein
MYDTEFMESLDDPKGFFGYSEPYHSIESLRFKAAANCAVEGPNMSITK